MTLAYVDADSTLCKLIILKTAKAIYDWVEVQLI
jgi:hypothetical protein